MQAACQTGCSSLALKKCSSSLLRPVQPHATRCSSIQNFRWPANTQTKKKAVMLSSQAQRNRTQLGSMYHTSFRHSFACGRIVTSSRARTRAHPTLPFAFCAVPLCCASSVRYATLAVLLGVASADVGDSCPDNIGSETSCARECSSQCKAVRRIHHCL
jgi:hypothetical protein